MTKKLIIKAYLIFIFQLAQIQAQDIPIGTWRNHLAFQPAQSLVITHEAVYCASDNGLFFIDFNSNSLNTLSKLNGLSENTLANLGFHEPTQTLVLVYQNGSIDFVQGNIISPFNLVRDADITGERQLNDLFFFGEDAYLSTDFGVVVINLSRQEIRATYQNIGSNGTRIPILGASISRDTVFLSSSEGILVGSLQDNLQDFNNWRLLGAESGLPPGDISGIVSRDGIVYAAINEIGLFRYNHTGTWEALSLPEPNPSINRLILSQGQIGICTPNNIFLLDAQEQIATLNDPLISNAFDLAFEANGTAWIADRQNGLLTNRLGTFESVFPNGPARAEAWASEIGNNEILALSGGLSDNFQALNRNTGFYTFSEGTWQSFNSFDALNATPIPPANDFLAALYNPSDQNTYFASFQAGLLVRSPNNTFTLIDDITPGSTFRRDIDGNLGLTSLARDSEGNVWITNFAEVVGQPILHVLRPDGSFQAFADPNGFVQSPLDVVIDLSGRKWMRLEGGGILVLDDQTNQGRFLSQAANSGNLPNRNVNDLVIDLDGQVWIGTDEGVGLFLSTFQVLDGVINAITPIFEGRPLLRAEKITAIAVDGGNRKWFGTNNGLWLFNEDGTELIERFTEDNSPLISNSILDITIEPSTGELFIATDQGFISYRGTATQGTRIHQNVQVFPNPVRPDFDGLVGISGLVENANVKITDASGRLFFEARAEGGTVTWDLRDYTGRRARTGVYLIFSTNADGTETLVTKVAVIE